MFAAVDASASSTFDEALAVELSASSVGSQFPVDPHASRGAPRREARASTSSTFRAREARKRRVVGLIARRLAIPRRSPRVAWGPAPGGSRLGLLYFRRKAKRRVVGLMRRLAIPRRSPRVAWGPAPGGSRLGLLYFRRKAKRRVVGLMRRLAIPRRSPRVAWGPAPGGSRLGLLYFRRKAKRRVVGLMRRLAIPRRSPRVAWGPAPGGSRRYPRISPIRWRLCTSDSRSASSGPSMSRAETMPTGRPFSTTGT